MTLNVALMLFVPIGFWTWIFYFVSKYKITSVSLLVRLFIGGCVSAGIALLLNHWTEKYTAFWMESPNLYEQIGFWAMVGLNEEFAKLLILLWFAYPQNEFQDPFDALVYTMLIALGFSFVENIVYWGRYGEAVLALRSVLTVPVHIFVSMPIAMALGKVHLMRPHASGYTRRIFYLWLGWLMAACLHALYDIFISFGYEKLAYLNLAFSMLIAIIIGYYFLRTSKQKLVAHRKNQFFETTS